MKRSVFGLLVGSWLLSSVMALANPVKALEQPKPGDWNDYWHQGQAEVTSYTLTQARYGESHPGHSVLVFVTEPFSKEKHVKLDTPAQVGSDAVPILKLNHTRKFSTGLYPYSMMRSVFTPVSGDPSLKVTTSVQEWCGHVFMQLNQSPQGYNGQFFSYFESEGDQKMSVPQDVHLEDSLWTLIRIDPQQLPTGDLTILPSTEYLRLKHVPSAPQSAKARWVKHADRIRYELVYSSINRKLYIDVEPAFPYRILKWAETYSSGWGAGAKELTTTGVKKSHLMIDYWNKNRLADKHLRTQLGLPEL